MRIEPEHVAEVVFMLRSWGHQISSAELEDLIAEFDTSLDLNGGGQHRHEDLDPAKWAAKANRKQLRVRALIAFASAGTQGLTNDELYRTVDPEGERDRDSWVPRVGELKRMGLVDETGATRTGKSGHEQTVHRVSMLGKDFATHKGWI